MASQRQTIGDPLGVALKSIKARAVADFMSKRPPGRAGKPLTAEELSALMAVVWKAFGAMAAPVSPDGSVSIGTQADANGDPQLTLQVSALDTAPFALYQFWRGSGYGLKDASRNQLDLTIAVGSETYADSATSGSGFSFTAGGYLRSEAAAFRRLGDISVGVSFQATSLPASGKWGCLFTVDGESGVSGDSNCLLALALLPSGKLKIAYEYNDAHVEEIIFDTALEAGKVYHVVLTRSGSSSYAYVNGEVIGHLTHTPVEGGANAVLNVGRFANNLSNSAFTGVIESLVFYDLALPASAVALLFHDEVMRWGSRPGGGGAPSAFTTAYEVDFTALAAQNLLTGGDGNKTVEGKSWVLANSSAGFSSAYINDGTHSGLYLKDTTTNTVNYATTLTAGALYVPLATLSSLLAKYQSHREIWVWVAFAMPTELSADNQTAMVSLFAGAPYTAAGITRVSYLHSYVAGSGKLHGHTHSCISGAHTSVGGWWGNPVPDLCAFRILDGTTVEVYAGYWSGGNWPDKSLLTRSSRAIFGTSGLVTRDNWYLKFSVFNASTVGNADMLIRKLKVEYR